MRTKVFLLTLLIANLSVIFCFWWQTNSPFIFTSAVETQLAFGRITGLLAAFTALLQFFLMGRIPLLERTFGLDRLAKIHKWNGYIAIVMILLHANLILSAYATQARISIPEQANIFLTQYPDIRNAQIAQFLFILIVLSSIYIVRKRLRYEAWYFVHLLTYLAIALAWGHQLYFGSDFAAQPLFAYYWYALYATVLGGLLIFRFLTPAIQNAKHRFVVASVDQENKDVYSIQVTGRHLDRLKVQPGQFFILRFLTKKFWWQPHPFSVSKLPQDNQIRFSIKALGDFTSQIKDLAPGTKVLLEGPYGVFTPNRAQGEKILCIAGGIGITPLRTLIQEFVAQGKDIVLLYSNKTRSDIVFDQEFNELAVNSKLQIIHYIATEHGATEVEGRLTKEKLTALVPDVLEREVFLCGPPGLMKAVRAILRSLGFPSQRLYFEEFRL